MEQRTRSRRARRYVVARADEIPPGGRKIVEVERRSIGIFNVDGEFFALRNRCPHQGARLCEGKLWGTLEADLPNEFRYDPRREILTCPWHGWEFHLRNGQSLCDPARLRTGTYAVHVSPGDALEETVVVSGRTYQKGPYSAETFPVDVEGAYVTVEVAG